MRAPWTVRADSGGMNTSIAGAACTALFDGPIATAHARDVVGWQTSTDGA